MTIILPLQSDLILAAAALIVALRTDMNGAEVCTVADVRPVLIRAMSQPGYCGLIATARNGEPIGYLGMNDRFAIYAGGAFAQITELYVVPEARRKGVAADLVTYAEARARMKSARSIELGAPPVDTHPGTQAFYGALGYLAVGPRMTKTL